MHEDMVGFKNSEGELSPFSHMYSGRIFHETRDSFAVAGFAIVLLLGIKCNTCNSFVTGLVHTPSDGLQTQPIHANVPRLALFN